jgi:uncharacterized protein (UPF0335 family)
MNMALFMASNGVSEMETTDPQLRNFFERIERLEEEKKGIADDIRDVFSEAKAVGHDVKAMRAVLRLRKMEAHARKELEFLVDAYKLAIGLE